jgi:hypothetical protein
MGERLDRALALAERLVAAVERIADIADRDVKPAKIAPAPKRARALTDEQAREITRCKLTRAGALPR